MPKPKPKTEIDYSNTIIYKITCKDTDIKELYVGHTTNFVQRKHAHKQSCMNPKSTNHTCKLYAIIREHGGWTNWIMEIIHFFKCNDQCEARTKEQEYFILLNATLNSVEPMPTPKEPVTIMRKPKAPIKIVTNPPVKIVHNIINNPNTYQCDTCNYTTLSSKDYNRHLSTLKHKNRYLETIGNQLVAQQTPNQLYQCEKCNKNYCDNSGLWRHKKKHHDSIINTDISNNFVIDKELVMLLIKENSELKTMMIDTQNQIIKHISKEKDPTFL